LPWFDKQEIPEKDIDKAKDIALMMVAERLRKAHVWIVNELMRSAVFIDKTGRDK
jgi:hypothetical protein